MIIDGIDITIEVSKSTSSTYGKGYNVIILKAPSIGHTWINNGINNKNLASTIREMVSDVQDDIKIRNGEVDSSDDILLKMGFSKTTK